MGENDVIDGIAAQTKLVERSDDIGQRIVAASVDESHATVIDNHVDRSQDGAHVAGVERDDAVAVFSPVEHFHTPPY